MSLMSSLEYLIQLRGKNQVNDRSKEVSQIEMQREIRIKKGNRTQMKE